MEKINQAFWRYLHYRDQGKSSLFFVLFVIFAMDWDFLVASVSHSIYLCKNVKLPTIDYRTDIVLSPVSYLFKYQCLVYGPSPGKKINWSKKSTVFFVPEHFKQGLSWSWVQSIWNLHVLPLTVSSGCSGFLPHARDVLVGSLPVVSYPSGWWVAGDLGVDGHVREKRLQGGLRELGLVGLLWEQAQWDPMAR